MKIVFVCSPFQGRPENIEKAKEYCRYVLEKGYIPLALTSISASLWAITTQKIGERLWK